MRECRNALRSVSRREARSSGAEIRYAFVTGCSIGLELKKDPPTRGGGIVGECREIALASSGTTIRNVAVPLVDAANLPAASLVLSILHWENTWRDHRGTCSHTRTKGGTRTASRSEYGMRGTTSSTRTEKKWVVGFLCAFVLLISAAAAVRLVGLPPPDAAS